MVAAFAGAHVIEIDLDDHAPNELVALGYKSGSIPAFHHVDAEGKAKGPGIDGGAWGENVPAEMAPVLADYVTHPN